MLVAKSAQPKKSAHNFRYLIADLLSTYEKRNNRDLPGDDSNIRRRQEYVKEIDDQTGKFPSYPLRVSKPARFNKLAEVNPNMFVLNHKPRISCQNTLYRRETLGADMVFKL
jgi:hypothetical protein